MPTDVTLDFSTAISGSLTDKDGEGIGFSSVQANSIGNAYDFGRIDLNTSTSSLTLTATQGSNASDNTLKNALEIPIDGLAPFTVSTRLKGPFTNFTAAPQQGGIFLGSNQDNYVKLVIINSSTNGLGLQFFEEQNGVSGSVGGGNAPQIFGLDATSINTLDLFINGDPTTGLITAAYRINSDTDTPTLFTQQFTPSSIANLFADAATARAGILAFTKDAADTTVTFESFSVKPSVSTDTNFRAASVSAFTGTTINWSTVKPSPIARSEAASAVAGGKLYVFGGYINTTYTPTKRADAYNPTNNTWTRIKDLPVGLTHAGTAVVGRNIYLAGGYPAKSTGGQRFATTDVWKYNIDTNTWTAMPDLPQARGSGGLEYLNGKLHFFGGSDINRADKGNHWVLSLNGGKNWVSAASLPNPRNHLADAVIGGKLYAIGGQRGQDHEGAQATVHVWNPAKPNTWTAVASLPRSRSHIGSATFVMDGRIIVAGGLNAQGRHVSDVTAYNPLNNTWRALTPLPTARSSGAAGSIGDRIFYTTGSANGFQSLTYRGVPTN